MRSGSAIRQRLAIHISANRAGDFFDRTEPVHRYHAYRIIFQTVFVHLPQIGTSQFGVDRAGCHCVYRDSMVGKFDGEIADKADHARFGSGIGAGAGMKRVPDGAIARAGRQADDPAIALVHHRRQRGLGAQEHRTQAEPHRVIPVFDVHVPDPAGTPAADIVHQNIGREACRCGRCEKICDCGLVRDIAGHR